MPAEAGETLYQVMTLVLLGPDSVHTGRRPAPATSSFNLFPEELEEDDNLVSSKGDDPVAARGEGGDRDDIASSSSESTLGTSIGQHNHKEHALRSLNCLFTVASSSIVICRKDQQAREAACM